VTLVPLRVRTSFRSHVRVEGVGGGYAYGGMGFPFDALEICACARFDVPRRGGGIANGSFFYVCLSAVSVSASVYVSLSV
jgi:hypothetical protein